MRRNQELFQSAVNLALEGATVVTENRRASRLVLSGGEQQLRARGNAWETPHVLPWNAWIQSAWQECVLGGATGLALLGSAQERALWKKVVSRSNRIPALSDASGPVALAMQAWRRMHEYGISLSASAFQTTPETRAFHEWACSFEDTCERNGWIDSAALPDALSTLLKCVSLPEVICFYGFDDFTPQQCRLHAALRDSGTRVDAGSADRGWELPQHVRCVSTSDVEAELNIAAQWARNTLAADPATRIGIVMPQLQQVRRKAENVFTRTLHPEAMLIGNADAPRAFDISLGASLSEYPLVRAALIATRLAIGPVPTHDAGILLRSPYIGSSFREMSERATVQVALMGTSGPETTLVQIEEAIASRSARSPVLRRNLQRFAAVAAALPPAMRPSQWAEKVSELLGALGWPGDDEGGRPLNSDEYQTLQAWSELLAALSSLDLVTPTLTGGALLQEITSLAQERIFKPENADAPVQLLGPLEAAGSCFDHLWMCGLSDDVWPSKASANPFLPLALQRSAGVPHSDPAQDFVFARRVTVRLAHSADGQVIFSWPRREEDSTLRPSPLLEGLTSVASDEVFGDPAPDWNVLQRTTIHESYDGERAPALDGEPVRGGTKVFELQSNCPFHAFAELRLGATRLDEPQPGLRARDRGKVIESALALVWAHLRDHFTLTNASRADLDRIIAKAVEGALAQVPGARETWEQRYRELERVRLIALVHDWLELEKKREAFIVVSHQSDVTVSAGGLSVKGRIDRLDRTHDGALVVLDYKSGNGSYGPGQWSGERPERPQLPLYVISQTQPVSAVAFAQVRPGECRLKGYGTRKEILGQAQDRSRTYFEGGTFEDRVAAWRPVLEKIGESFRAGVAAPDPLPERVCEYCHLPGMCRRSEQESGDPCQHGEVDDDE